MRLIRETKPGRQAFTLIEMVIVIAIILTLAALLLSAVFKAMTLADELKNTNDIRQLDLAVQAFKSKFNVDYIPSRFFLSNSLSDYPSSPPTTLPNLKWDSLLYLQRLWPRLNFAGSTAINWSPASGQVTGGWTLEGNQCLVFFLGGIPNLVPNSVSGTPSCNGFSNDPTNPTNLAATSGTIPPFYNFLTERLHLAGSTALGTNFAPGPTGAIFFDYLDSYGGADVRLF